MVKAVRIHEQGGAEKLVYEDVDVGQPGEGEVLLKQNACGLNYIDVYMRSGLYPVEPLPAVIGMEGAGVVEAVGPGVTDFQEGDRAAYPMVRGGYTEQRVVPAAKLVKLPDGIDDETAASMMLKGLTAHYLSHRTYKAQKGDPILVYAAAGGVGLILCQWLKYLGCTVIGCVGTRDKAELAKVNGCDHTILYREEKIPERVKEITGGEGVAAAYDSIGKATFMDSLDSLRPFGVLATFGNATGKVDPFDPAVLGPKGSLYVTRPTLATHTATRKLLQDGADALFKVVLEGHVKIHKNRSYPLAETADAHRALEARETTGSTVLMP